MSSLVFFTVSQVATFSEGNYTHWWTWTRLLNAGVSLLVDWPCFKAHFLSATGKIPVGGFKDCDCPEILTWRPKTMLTSYNREDGRESILCRQAQGVVTRLSLLGTGQDKGHVSVFASKRKVGQEITLAWLVGKPREERRYLVWTSWSLDGDLSVARRNS